MSLDAGDPYEGRWTATTVPSDGTGAAGDLVEIASGQASQMAAGSTGVIFGVLLADAPAAGEDVEVLTAGKVVANADGGVAIGNGGVSGSNAGQVAAGSSGNFVIEGTGVETPSGTAVLEMR
jgi:hypothetical protein